MFRGTLFMAVVALLAGLLSAPVSAQTWTMPTATPPEANATAPINVSDTHQVKSGGISVGSISVTGGGYFAGNLGIGTSNPRSALHLSGRAAHPVITLTNTANTPGHRSFRIAANNDRLSLQVASDDGASGLYDVLSVRLKPASIRQYMPPSRYNVVNVSGELCLSGVCSESWEIPGVPSGAVMAFDLAACPSGWYAHGNIVGRTIIGAGSAPGLTPRATYDYAGSETHTLSVTEMPSHGHRVYGTGDAVQIATAVSLGYPNNPALVGKEASNSKLYMNTNAAGTVLVEPSGGGQAHNNMQPSYALLYCVKS